MKNNLFLGIFLVLVVALVSAGVFIWGHQSSEHLAWIYLDRFGLILGLIAFVPVLFAVTNYIQYIGLQKRELQKIRTLPGTSPVVFVVSIGGMSIINEVEAFLRQTDGFEDFNFEQRVIKVEDGRKEIQESDIDGLLEKIHDAQNNIRAKAPDKIHLFVKAPVPVATMLGEVLANGIPTIIYHKQPNKGYQNWGALHR